MDSYEKSKYTPNKKIRVKQFLNILEQLPRLCSPTICGTLSQPTTKSERASCGAEMFEWSLEQKAILSPANITTDTDGTDDWQNASELNSAWRQQESEQFFSQRTIAPSPLISTPSTTAQRRSNFRRPFACHDIINDEDEEDETEGEQAETSTSGHNRQQVDDKGNKETNYSAYSRTKQDNDSLDKDKGHERPFKNIDHDQGVDHENGDRDEDMSRFYDRHEYNNNNKQHDNEEDDDEFPISIQETPGDDFSAQEASEVEDVDCEAYDEEEIPDDNLLFSPQPMRSSQTQQNMDVFSPDTFSRVMDDENTLQSTPKLSQSSVQRNYRSIYRRSDIMYD